MGVGTNFHFRDVARGAENGNTLCGILRTHPERGLPR